MQRKFGIIIIIIVYFIVSCSSGVSKERLNQGKALYEKYCLSCHMEDGTGVPNLNAPLAGSKYAVGDKTKLIQIVFLGSEAFLDNPDRPYSNLMPSFNNLTDLEIADVLTYIRNSFGNKSGQVLPEDVKAVRDEIY